MRTQLVNILRRGAAQAEHFNDYNFRVYFVNKFNNQLSEVESNVNLAVTEQMIQKAEAEAAMVTRQTSIQELRFIFYRVSIFKKSSFMRNHEVKWWHYKLGFSYTRLNIQQNLKNWEIEQFVKLSMS